MDIVSRPDQPPALRARTALLARGLALNRRTGPDTAGVPPELAALFESASRGDGLAQVALGIYYNHGLRVSQDCTKAAKWYRKAAEQGNAHAQCNLGVLYRFGQGVPQDYAEAVKWYRKAAEQGHADAQHNLGVAYYRGEGRGSVSMPSPPA